VNTRLPQALILSLALHGILVTGFSGSLVAPTRDPPGSVIQVALQAERQTATVTQSATTIPDSAREYLAAAMPVVVADADSTPSDSGQNIRDTDREHSVQNHLLGEINSRLSRYLVYPPIAREHGWEGTVLLRLHVEPDGLLNRIRVRLGSGYDVLDRAAIDSLHKVERIADATAWLNGQGHDVDLPVIYRLKER
jgi:protein TonB